MTVDKQTYTFKVVGSCEIQADVYRASDDAASPVIMWIHGGALIVGHRGNINPEQLNMYVNAGYALVSIDYRLAPETKLKAIIEDIRDAYRWMREEGPDLFHIDPGQRFFRLLSYPDRSSIVCHNL